MNEECRGNVDDLEKRSGNLEILPQMRFKTLLWIMTLIMRKRVVEVLLVYRKFSNGVLSGLKTRSVHYHKLKSYSDSFEIRSLDIEDFGRKAKAFYIDEGPRDFSSPPMLIIGGTAQTISTFTMHIKPLAKLGRVIFIELRGQGSTELASEHAHMKQHVEDLHNILAELGLQRVNLVGFSFGGRIALAYAAHHPAQVNKLSITGVCYSRPKLGELILKSWAEALQRGNLRDCAWSFLLNGYSPAFIEKYFANFSSFVDMVVTANKVEKLYDLIRLSHASDKEDLPYGVIACTARIRCPTQIIAATEDRIAGYNECLELGRRIDTCVSSISLSAGHLAPFEQPSQWRKALTDFLLYSP
jgi:pimeloyl-ACP methyl ester carboxylesterase